MKRKLTKVSLRAEDGGRLVADLALDDLVIDMIDPRTPVVLRVVSGAARRTRPRWFLEVAMSHYTEPLRGAPYELVKVRGDVLEIEPSRHRYIKMIYPYCYFEETAE